MSYDEVKYAIEELQKNGIPGPYWMKFSDQNGNEIKVIGSTTEELYNNYLKSQEKKGNKHGNSGT